METRTRRESDDRSAFRSSTPRRIYRNLGFLTLDVVEGHSEARPKPTAMFLPLADIEAARGT